MSSTEPGLAPVMDRGHRFDADGNPLRPLADLGLARYMTARGFARGDVEHILGYLPAGWDEFDPQPSDAAPLRA